MNPAAATGVRPRLVVFAKAPQAGAVKTRLIPALGAQGAAALARSMLDHALQQALAADIGRVELCMSPVPDAQAWQDIDLPDTIELTAQGEGGLGERMGRAVHRVTTDLRQPVLLMGTDCPELTARQIRQAALELERHDAVLVPVVDGGYVLIGLKAPWPEIFTDMPWSTSVVAAETIKRLATLGLQVWEGPQLHDIDEPSDLAYLPATLRRLNNHLLPSHQKSL